MVEPGEPFILQPREFVLAITEEKLELDSDVLGRLEGRSSLGPYRDHRAWNRRPLRSGLERQGHAGTQQSGPDAGRALSRDAYLLVYFRAVSSPSAMPYRTKPNNKYAGQTQPLASRLDREVSEVTSSA